MVVMMVVVVVWCGCVCVWFHLNVCQQCCCCSCRSELVTTTFAAATPCTASSSPVDKSTASPDGQYILSRICLTMERLNPVKHSSV